MKKREKEYFLPPCNSLPSMLPTFAQTVIFIAGLLTVQQMK
jgi:hypothetical protein